MRREGYQIRGVRSQSEVICVSLLAVGAHFALAPELGSYVAILAVDVSLAVGKTQKWFGRETIQRQLPHPK